MTRTARSSVSTTTLIATAASTCERTWFAAARSASKRTAMATAWLTDGSTTGPMARSIGLALRASRMGSRTRGLSRPVSRCASISPPVVMALRTVTKCTMRAPLSAPNRTPTATAGSISGNSSITASCVSCSSTPRWPPASRIDGWSTRRTAYSSASIPQSPGNRMNTSSRRAATVAFIALLTVASAARAQDPPKEGRFITGPLAWTPTFELRDAGTDSNVFNTPSDAKEDVTATARSQVDSVLKLGLLRATTVGSLAYNYFQQYTSQRGLNRRVATHVEVPTMRFSPDLTVSWGRAKERSGNEIDIRTPRTDFAYAGGLQARLTSKLSVIATAGQQKSTYDSGFTFHDTEIAQQLNRESTMATVTARVALTPLTSLFIDATAAHDSFPFRPTAATDNGRIDARLEFAPDAVIRGTARVGYRSMQPHYGQATQSAAAAFSGITSSIDLGYTLLGVTRFIGHFSRDANYSLYIDQPYYRSTAGGLQILHRLFGPIDLDVRGSLESLDYPQTETEAAYVDTAETLAGGLSIRVSNEAVLALLYDTSERRSERGRDFEYQRRRVYTTITYGF